MKPIIGIISRPIISDDNRLIEGCYDKMRRSIIKSGGIPINILSTENIVYDSKYESKELTKEEKDDLERILKLCDGFVFQGGTKIYSYDKFVANYIISNDLPTLGICLGMQLLNIVDTNTKLEKIESGINHNLPNDIYVHSINLVKDSLLYNIIKKDEIKVSSSHEMKIRETKNFSIDAVIDDVIEAIHLPNKKFILGVQFHPELMFESDINAQLIFKKLIEVAKYRI